MSESKNPNKRTEPIKKHIDTVRIDPQPGVIIVELIEIKSKIEKDLIAKNPSLIITKETIKSRMTQIMSDESKTILDVYDQHPDQAVIVAIPYELAEERGLRINDKIAFHRTEHTGRPIIYNKKKYMSLHPSEILFRYLTDQV